MSAGLYSQPLRNCCFCMSLRSGVTLIGSLSMLLCTLELVYACQKLNVLLDREQICLENLSGGMHNREFESLCSHLKIVRFMLIVDFVMFIIGFNGSIMLLYGIKSRQPRLFWGWLLFCGLVICSNVFSVLVWNNVNLILHLFIVVMLAYFFRVVRSYYIELLDEHRNGGSQAPVVAVSFPNSSASQIFFPTQRRSHPGDQIKDDPPPPYPGTGYYVPPVSSVTDSSPPPYSAIDALNVDNDGRGRTSSSTTVQLNAQPQTSEAASANQDSSNEDLRRDSHSSNRQNSLSPVSERGSMYGSAEWNPENAETPNPGRQSPVNSTSNV